MGRLWEDAVSDGCAEDINQAGMTDQLMSCRADLQQDRKGRCVPVEAGSAVKEQVRQQGGEGLLEVGRLTS
jgi:hypothetical protein